MGESFENVTSEIRIGIIFWTNKIVEGFESMNRSSVEFYIIDLSVVLGLLNFLRMH